MLETGPPRLKPAALATGISAVGLAMTVVGSIQLASSGVSPLLVIWMALALAGLPLALWSGYHLYGLLSARYRLDREALTLRWGWVFEVLPLQQLQLLPPDQLAGLPRPGGVRLPGTLLGTAAGDGGTIEYLATDADRLLGFQAGSRRFVISPPSPGSFEQAFTEANRLGSLREVEPVSRRPDLLPARMWTDLPARLMLIAGLLAPLALISYLGVRAASLPASLAFGFTPAGAPGPLAPPGRLLLLPLIGGLVWLTDLLVGAWLYRRRHERALAYGLWALAIVVNLLLWGAGLRMMGAGP